MSYDFRALSPVDFEDLVRDLLQADLGVHLESFGPGRDQGIDFRHAHGTRQLIVQAKHYPESGLNGLLRVAKSEAAKVLKLAPDRYILATSVSLSPQAKAKLLAAFPGVNLTEGDIWGREDINAAIGRHSAVERRFFKLWLSSTAVLDRMLHSGLYNRTDAELDLIKSSVPRFVYNDSVPRAEALLDQHRMLIIAGEPGVGKTTLARLLVWLHVEQGWKVTVIDEIADVFEVGAGDDERRLVLFDDFLGQIQLTPDLIRGVDQRFTALAHRFQSNKNLRLILTTRDYIFNQARSQSQRLGGPKVDAIQYTLNVGVYTRLVRAHIVYNHLFFCDLNPDQKQELLSDDFYMRIIDHKNFNPRLIEMITSADYLSLTGAGVRESALAALDNPEALWDRPFRAHISAASRALLMAVFFLRARTSLTLVEAAFRRLGHALGLSPSNTDTSAFRSSLREVEGSFLAIVDRSVRFANPGVRDYLRRVIGQDGVLLKLLGCAMEVEELDAAFAFMNFPTGSPKLVGPGGTPVPAVPKAVARPEFLGALRRIRQHEAFRPHELLSTALGLFDYFGGEEFAQLVSEIAEILGQSDLDHGDAEDAVSMLRSLAEIPLPIGVMAVTKSALSSVTRELLSNYGPSLQIDELKSIEAALVEFGDGDEDADAQAMRESLEGHVEDLRDHLGELSLDDVKTYRDDLFELMSNYGLSTATADYRFDERITRLEELEDRYHDGEGYGGRGRGDSGYISDSSIQSLFGGLKEH
jgi:hypothetical protein